MACENTSLKFGKKRQGHVRATTVQSSIIGLDGEDKRQDYPLLLWSKKALLCEKPSFTHRPQKGINTCGMMFPKVRGSKERNNMASGKRTQ